MMDFTYADMKFRSHFNDDEEEEYVSQSFTRFRIKVQVTNIFLEI